MTAAALCVTVAQPAFADPVPAGAAVPDAGSRPAVAGSVQLSGAVGLPTGVQPVAATLGPLGQRIMTESAALETLGQQLLKLDGDLEDGRRSAVSVKEAWTRAARELSDLRDRVGHEAGEAYKAATALGPLESMALDLHQLSVLAPGIGQQPGGQGTARDVERAEQVERAASAAHQAAVGQTDAMARQRSAIKADYDKRNAALTDLRTQNSTAYQRELAAIDAHQASIGSGLKIGSAVKGKDANPLAKRALQFAVSKQGSPYVWGDEGPNTFDCSGLILWSYQQVGYAGMPRVANDQYAHTALMSVKVEELLPGDLLFFATSKADSRSIHHVAMYYGNGYMLHAPTTGDVVKLSPIWWSEFYGATRVYAAVDAPTPAPAPPVAPAPGPTTPPPSNPIPPSTPPSSQPSTPPSTSPSPSPSTNPSTSPSPAPAPSASAAPAASSNPPTTSASAATSAPVATSAPATSAPATSAPAAPATSAPAASASAG